MSLTPKRLLPEYLYVQFLIRSSAFRSDTDMSPPLKVHAPQTLSPTTPTTPKNVLRPSPPRLHLSNPQGYYTPEVDPEPGPESLPSRPRNYHNNNRLSQRVCPSRSRRCECGQRGKDQDFVQQKTCSS